MNYKRWCEMSDDEARRELDRLAFWDAVYEAAFMFTGCVIIVALIWFGVWLWD